MATIKGLSLRWSRLARCIGIRIFAAALAYLCGPSGLMAMPPPPPRGVALVVGNSNYSDSSSLRNHTNEARAIAARLRDLNFIVTEAFDLDLAGFRSALDDFRTAGQNVAVVYYSGRGAWMDGAIYLTPVDANLSPDRPHVPAGMISLEDVAWKLLATDNVLIVDSRLGDAEPGAAAEWKAQAWTSRPPVLPILFAFSDGMKDAGAPGQDTTGSPYAAALLNHLGTRPGKSLVEVLEQVSAAVGAATDGQQRPWFVSTLETPLRMQLHPRKLAQHHLRQAKSLIETGSYEGVLDALEAMRSIHAEEDLNSAHPWGILRRLEDTSLELLYEADQGYPAQFGDVRGMVDAIRTEIAGRKARARAAINEMEFVRILAGSFQMGSVGVLAQRDERPVTTVRISKPYFLGKYEVTQGQWEAVMGTNPSHFADCGEDCPVEDVAWSMVQSYLRQVNELERETGYEYRLPTEAEWEYAARAGTETHTHAGNLADPDGVDANLGRVAWYDRNSGGRTHPVGVKEPNEFGLHDLLGNVSEWVQDRKGRYLGGTISDPLGPGSGEGQYRWDELRVHRGGSFRDEARGFRSADRSDRVHNRGEIDLGFRIVRTPR